MAAPANRAGEEAAARDVGGLVDLDELPHGQGRWEWLDDAVDQPMAEAGGLATPIDVVVARMRGVFANTPTNERPRVVFYPDSDLLNPEQQPAVPGHWEYITTRGDGAARALADINIGGQGLLPHNPLHPSAEDVWVLRENIRMRRAEGYDILDRTLNIDIVWVPDETTDDDHGNESSSISSEAEIDRDVTDLETGLTHEPTNRGENDQTGVFGERIYQSRLINKTKYTVDRSRAHANNEQQHKSWYVNALGQWKQYSSYGSLDWTNRKVVEKMNKWREQAFGRNGWPSKRKETREDYTDEELDWLFEFVKKAEGGRPDITMNELTARFNQTFSSRPARNKGGITSVYDRLKQEWKDNGGVRRPRPGR